MRLPVRLVAQRYGRELSLLGEAVMSARTGPDGDWGSASCWLMASTMRAMILASVITAPLQRSARPGSRAEG